MLSGASLLLIILLLGTVAYFRVASFIAIPTLLLLLLGGHQLGVWGTGAWIAMGATAIVAAIWWIPPLRYSWFSKPFFRWFRAILPPMSETEKAAIEAGEVGWEKYLFQGDTRWKTLLELPRSTLSKEEQDFLDNQVETLCAMLNDWQIVHEQANLPIEVWQYIKKERFFGMIIPKEYGGLGFSVRAHSEIITKIATRCGSAAVNVMVPNSLGPAELLLHYGTEEQKNQYLPTLAVGQDIPCFALTSTEAGSDAGSMIDTGIVCYAEHNGKNTLGIRLTFSKRYITLAPVATLVGVAFKLFDPNKLLGEQTNIGITLALIPATHPGVEIGKRHFPLNMAFMNGPVEAKDIFIPMEWIIGGQSMAGHGWRMLMECLSVGRGISLPALATATGLLSTRMTSAYVSIRKQFKLPIAAFEGVEEALARIFSNSYLLQASRLFTVISIDKYLRPSVATAMAKFHMTELSRQVINDAMDIHGGRGIMLGPKNYLGRAYQSMPISITVEGANILTRNLMIFGQGAIRCHPYAREEMEAAALYATAPQESLKKFDKLLFKHITYIISNKVRCWVLSLTRGRLVPTPATGFVHYYLQKLTWLSSGLAFTADLSLMLMGGALKRRERLSARLGDVLSQLYLASAAVKFYFDNQKNENENPILKRVLQQCCFQAQEAFYHFFDNAPNWLLRCPLKFLIFPFGKVFSAPSDQLDHQTVRAILDAPDFRKQFTSLCYVGKGLDCPTGLMEMTLDKLNEVKPWQQKLNHAIKSQQINASNDYDQMLENALSQKILSAHEVEQLRIYETLRTLAVSVDAFSPEYPLGSQQ